MPIGRVHIRPESLVSRIGRSHQPGQRVKGGKNFSFSALVVGDGKGIVGYGNGSAREVPRLSARALSWPRRTSFMCRWLEPPVPHEDEYGFGPGQLRPAEGYRRHRRRSRAGGPEVAGFRTCWRSRWVRPTRTTWSRPRSTPSKLRPRCHRVCKRRDVKEIYMAPTARS